MKHKLGKPTSSSPSQVEGKDATSPLGWTWPPHLHLNVGVGQVVLRRQLAVIVDKVVQDGGTQDGLQQGREGVRKGLVAGTLRVAATQVPHVEGKYLASLRTK